MKKINQIKTQSVKSKSKNQDILELIETIADYFGVSKKELKKAFGV